MSDTNVLLTPHSIGAVEIKNRIVMAPMTTRLADPGGFVTENAIDYYMARVSGGVGLSRWRWRRRPARAVTAGASSAFTTTVSCLD